MTKTRLASAIAAGLFVVLTILVGADALTRVDQAALDHVMPGLTGAGGREPTLVSSAFPIFHSHEHRGRVALAAVTYGVVWIASAVPSIVIVGICVLLLWRRGNTRLAGALAAAFVAANAVELLGKSAIERASLYTHQAGEPPMHVAVFDMSFPSGHATRGMLLALAVALWAPRLRPFAGVWMAGSTILLVVGGWHTPTDVAGGVLLGAAAGLWALSLGRGRESRPGRYRAARASPS